MADKEHFELVMRDVNAWNKWREENPKERPDLSFAVMRGADLMLANLSGALLSGADLRHADLRGANLVAARLMGADLSHANICGADLSTAEDLTEEQLRHTHGDAQTRLPEDVHAPENWPKKGRTAAR